MVEFDVPGFQIGGEDQLIDAGGGPTDEEDRATPPPSAPSSPPKLLSSIVSRLAVGGVVIANIVAQGTLLGLFGAVVACGVAAARQPDRGGEAWRALVSCAVAVSAAVGVMVVAPQGDFSSAIVLVMLCVGALVLFSVHLHGTSLAVMVDPLVWMASAMWVFIVFAATGAPIEIGAVPADPIAELALRAELNRTPRWSRTGSVIAIFGLVAAIVFRLARPASRGDCGSPGIVEDSSMRLRAR